MQKGRENYAAMGMGGYKYQSEGKGNYTVTTEIGDIHVHVTNPNATTEDIYKATIQAVQDENKKKTSRQLRELAGVYQ